MKKWISLVALLAFVVTTMPSFAHASVDHGTSQTKAEKVHKHPCCPDHAEKKTAPTKTAHNAPCKSCGDKNCKCLGGACGSSSVLGSQSLTVLPPITVASHFSTTNETAASDHDGRIKRPPRA